MNTLQKLCQLCLFNSTAEVEGEIKGEISPHFGFKISQFLMNFLKLLNRTGCG